MIDSEEIPLLLLIVGACVVVFLLTLLPGIVTHDYFSHELDPSKAIMFDEDGSIKKSFWSWDSMVQGGESELELTALDLLQPVDQNGVQANPFSE